MKFGICTSVGDASAVKEAGGDYLEASVQELLRGLEPDEQWTGMEQVSGSPVPVSRANLLLPASLKMTGPEADPGRLRAYMQNVVKRAEKVGIKILVMGSAGSRNVPEGFDRETAKQQIIKFARMGAELASRHDVTIVAEPLNRGESNIINSVAEGMSYVKAVDHPNFRCLVDSYHFWLEEEPLDHLRAAMPWIRHVHVADKDGRVAPGESGKSDYRPFFKVLKEGGYDGTISVEALNFTDVAFTGPKVIRFLREQWDQA